MLSFSNFYQVANSVDHAQNLGSGLVLNDLVQFMQTQGIEGPLLTSRTIDSAYNLFNLNFSHNECTNF